MADPTRSTINITVGGWDISADVIYSRTNFTSSASAQPGTCTIAVRDPNGTMSFQEGSSITLDIDGQRRWRGYLFTVTRGYAFADAPVREWTLSGVDLNILLDKLVLYNHAHPERYPDGAGTYRRQRVIQGGVTRGWMVAVPIGTQDGDYIKAMLDDFDIDLVSPTIKKGRIEDVGTINPDGLFTPPPAGMSLRDFLTDVSRNVNRSAPGSTIWYVDPEGYLVYKAQDTEAAPFWVGDGDPTEVWGDVQGENVRDLSVTTSISSIKNDVIVWAGDLNPAPGSRQKLLKYKHLVNETSVATYGRFQYSEVLASRWTQTAINARANKIINQEGEPGMSADFTTYRAGLYPGQIIWIWMEAHGFIDNLPIRSISMNFPLPDVVEYRVSCSYDTQDPWGLLLALKKPESRGLKQPNFYVRDLRANPEQTTPSIERYVLVKEYPASIGGRRYQCTYAYIRDSLSVYVGGIKQVSALDPETGTVGFLQTNPGDGSFKLAEDPTGGKRVYCEYYASGTL